MKKITPTEKQRCRFIAKLSAPHPITGCLVWCGAVDRAGYGNVRWSGRCLKAHRAAFILVHGSIPEGLDILHSCDTPSCCEVSHLRAGTDKENARDRDTRHRRRPPTGSLNGQARLTEQQVLEIRATYRGTLKHQKELAEKYEIRQSTVCDIVYERSWKHLISEGV
jgi:hypothetical protein